MREQRGIAVFVAFGCAAGINAPAVANNEHDWLGHGWRTLPTIRERNKRFFR